jgi:predicted lipoprotein
VQKKIAQLVVGTLVGGILLYYLPLFRIRTLSSANSTNANSRESIDSNAPRDSSTRDLARILEDLWTQQLPEAASRAVSVDEVLAAARTDAGNARKKYGREVGIGGPTFLFLRGRGRIASVNEDQCAVIVNDQSQTVVLEIGFIVSNAIRDASGLVNVEDFSSSQDFNLLSTELNSRCEAEVIEPIRDLLTVGALVEFVGCGEVRYAEDFDPLKLIPIQLRTFPAVQSE